MNTSGRIPAFIAPPSLRSPRAAGITEGEGESGTRRAAGSLIRSRRDGAIATLRRLHENEVGLLSIEMVLVLCAGTTVLALAFNLLWGKQSDGLIADHIKKVIHQFTELFDEMK